MGDQVAAEAEEAHLRAAKVVHLHLHPDQVAPEAFLLEVCPVARDCTGAAVAQESPTDIPSHQALLLAGPTVVGLGGTSTGRELTGADTVLATRIAAPMREAV